MWPGNLKIIDQLGDQTRKECGEGCLPSRDVHYRVSKSGAVMLSCPRSSLFSVEMKLVHIPSVCPVGRGYCSKCEAVCL